MIAGIARQRASAENQDLTTASTDYAIRNGHESVNSGSRYGSGADPSGPARKLEGALAR